MKAIIFDMDGVLVDSMPDHADAWRQVFASVGIRIERKEIYELEGSNHRQVIELMFRRFGRSPPTEEEIQELSRRKIEIFNRIEHVRPFEGMKELLSVLAPKYKLAVVSGSNRTTVHNIINTFFPDTFQVIIDGEDVQSKPAPEPYLKAVEKLGVPKEQCLVIENAPLGIRSAKNAGLRCIAIPTYLDRESVKEADVIADSHRELERILFEEIGS